MVTLKGTMVSATIIKLRKIIRGFIPLNRVYVNGIYINDIVTILVDDELIDIEPIKLFDYDVDTIIVNDNVILVDKISREPDIDKITELYLQSVLNLYTYQISTDKKLYFRDSGISIFDDIANFTNEHQLISEYLTRLLGVKQLDVSTTNQVGALYSITVRMTREIMKSDILSLPNNIWKLRVVNNFILITYENSIHNLHYKRLKEIYEESNIDDGSRYDRPQFDIYGEGTVAE